MRTDGASLTLVVKPTEACNARCGYCYDRLREAPSPPAAASWLDQVLADVDALIGGGRTRSVGLLWHGGEPLLLGATFFERVLAWQRARPKRGVAHRLQTNLTLLDDVTATTLASLLHDRTLGSSVDPIDATSGPRQLAKSGASYLGQWRRGFQVAASHGLRVGVVYVIHPGSVGRSRDVYHFFRNLGRPFAGLRLSAVIGRTGHVAGADLGRFLIELYRLWDGDGRPFPLAPVQAWEAIVEGRPALPTCAERGDCRDVLAVGPDLRIHRCGRMMALEDRPLGRIGADGGLPAVLAADPWAGSACRRATLMSGACGQCTYLALCNGGCAAESLAASGTELGSPPSCEGQRRFFEWRFGGRLPHA